MPHLDFSIVYKTEWGQDLHIDYAIPGQAGGTIGMGTADGECWQAALEVPAGTEEVAYAYRVSGVGNPFLRAEKPLTRTVRLSRKTRLLLADAWSECPMPDVLSRSAFTQCVYRPQTLEHVDAPFQLVMHAPPPPKGFRWGVAGSTPSLGEWRPEAVRMLARTGCYEWKLPLFSTDFIGGAEYKYVLVDETDARHVVWESGGNRVIVPQRLQKNESALRQDDMPRMALAPWRGAGVVIPVFSLRSRRSFGIGDFGDLSRLIDWAAQSELKAVQLLPINDTTATGTWRDSYPYSSISVFALHPLYIDASEWASTEAYKRHAEAGRALNGLAELDYEGVFAVKMAFLRDLFKEKGAATLRSKAFKTFVDEQKKWLWPYALFCHLRDANGTADFRKWGRFAGYDAEALRQYVAGDSEARRQTDFYCYVQFLLHRQITKVHEHARSCGIVLKGDIPIGICRDSVPAWVDTRLFRFDGQAGAPPDGFAKHGQNWGFPTYDWEEMRRDGYAWWRERLRVMGHCFDAYRIDHVLGFFRIWEIPCTQVYGLLGRFRPALPLDAGEISRAGFRLSPAALSRPLLTRRRLEELSEEVGGHGLKRFFREVDGAAGWPWALPAGEKWYTLRPEADTQRKILALVPEGKLRSILLDAVAEVLFIPDPEAPCLYHPRIAAQQTFLFSLLGATDRQAFNRLYDDFFYVRHNLFWAEEALRKLPAITGTELPAVQAESAPSLKQNTPDAGEFAPNVGNPASGGGGPGCTPEPLLPCAEDLGMVPASVKNVLEQLGMLSLEIQRMPKRYGYRFDDVRQNPYLSVATIATHDMPPLRLWWKEDREQTQAFWQDVLGRGGQAPAEATPEVCEQVVAMHLESPSMLCLLALQDWLAMDGRLRRPVPEEEQINVPANAEQNWCYRMHLTLEELAGATAFNEKVRGLVERSGR